MGQENSKGGPETNFVSTGHSSYVNEKGETVTESYRLLNGDFLHQRETGKLPANGGFISQTSYAPWVVASAATVLVVFSVVLFVLTKRGGPIPTQKKRNSGNSQNSDNVETPEIPLYSLEKQRSRHPSEAMWNIDLLDDVN